MGRNDATQLEDSCRARKNVIKYVETKENGRVYMKLSRIMLTAAGVLAVMAVIFYFSSQTGSESAETSGGIVDFLLRRLTDAENQLSPAQMELREKVHFLVRKTAHFAEYALLGISLMLHIRAIYAYISAPSKAGCWLSWGIGTVYACLDEYHQFFSADRAPQLRDVCLDSAGVLGGILLSVAVLRLIEYRKKNASTLAHFDT